MSFNAFCKYMGVRYGMKKDVLIIMLYHDSTPRNPLFLMALYRYCRKKGYDLPEVVLRHFDDLAGGLLGFNPAAKSGHEKCLKESLGIQRYQAFSQFHSQWLRAYVQVRVREERWKRQHGHKDNEIYDAVCEELKLIGEFYEAGSLKKFMADNSGLSTFLLFVENELKRQPRNGFDTKTGAVLIADFL